MGVCLAGVTVWRGGSVLRETTVYAAWKWGIAATFFWGLVWVLDSCGKLFSSAVSDHLWYGCAVLSVCPPIAVLGSRRPGNRVWTQFILFPMLLALAWPLMALRLQGSEFRELYLETPQLIGMFLVLVMGIGNYCGTRHTLSALIYGTSVLAVVLTCSARAGGWITDRSSVREWSTLGAAIAMIFVLRSGHPIGQSRFDRVWFDFLDTFGIVWGRRIQDRINFVAEKEGWPVRLVSHGFVSIHPAASMSLDSNDMTEVVGKTISLASDARIEHTIRWLLRRFVDPSWCDARLGQEQREGLGKQLEIRVDS